MKFSREEEFIIPKDKVITIVEVDTEVQIVLRYVSKEVNGDFITGQGRLSTVEESLELT